MNNYAVVVAAGSGTRMGAGISKQYLMLRDKPILAHTLLRIAKLDFIYGIVVVAKQNEIDYCGNEVVDKFKVSKVVDIVEGGSRRQDSVFNGLKSIRNRKPDLVFIHDGVRPLFSQMLFKNVFENAKVYGAAIAAAPVVCTIKESDDQMLVKKTVSRDKLWEIQTPQCFSFDLIFKAYLDIYSADESILLTDESMALEFAGMKVKIVEGGRENIKITNPVDLIIAEQILEKENFEL